MLNTNLTDRETRVALILVNECLAGMGGERPADLGDDEYTWIAPEDLRAYGYSPKQTSGFWSSLMEKGFVELWDTNEWVLATEAWQYLDTIWDDKKHLIEGGDFPID